MKYVMIVLVLFGCAGGHDADFTGKIRDWQKREALCEPVCSACVPADSLLNALASIRSQYGSLSYVAENGDHWKTSAETFNDCCGDCEDLAIFHYRAIIDSCLPSFYDIDVRLRTIKVDGKNHTVVIVYSGQDVYEINNLRIFTHETDGAIVAEFDDKYIFQS